MQAYVLFIWPFWFLRYAIVDNVLAYEDDITYHVFISLKVCTIFLCLSYGYYTSHRAKTKSNFRI